MARARKRWHEWSVLLDDVHFDDGWDRYVVTTRNCDVDHTQLHPWDALRVLLRAVRDSQLDPAQLGAHASDLEWTLEIALERGLTVQRWLSPAEHRAARKPAQSLPEPGPDLAEIAIEVVAAGEPIGGIQVEVVAPDGSVHSQRTSPEGAVVVSRIPPGACRVRFPGHDASAWKGLTGTARLAERLPSQRHVVSSGECLSHIAHAYGHSHWRAVWDHAENAALRQKRKSPHVLHAGDVLEIPGLQMAELVCSTNATHRIEVTVRTLELKVVLADHLARPFACQPYQLWCDTCDGEPLRRGATTSLGAVEEQLPCGTRTVFVLLEKQGLPFTFQLSAVPELPESCDELSRTDVAAIQARLNAIGVGAGPVTGSWNPATQRALQTLRRGRGEYDDAALNAGDLDALHAFGV